MRSNLHNTQKQQRTEPKEFVQPVHGKWCLPLLILLLTSTWGKTPLRCLGPDQMRKCRQTHVSFKQ